MNTTNMGTCTLVGAGPGDPELLTLKAVKAIQAATVLLVDDLVNQDILQWARPDARVIQVGKRGGCKSTPQAFIEKLMVAAVLAGEHVVRLKGGDPFIFGRGGEEVEHLRAQGIEAAVVNGITSGLAAITSLGAPLTHRDRAHGVLFMTGHAKPGEAETDWRQVGASAHALRLTLVVYMGVRQLQRVQDGLLASMPGQTPAAIVRDASGESQQQFMATLATLGQTAQRYQIASPAVIIIGDVLKGASALASSGALDLTSGSHGQRKRP